jgi:hypothetical protein
LAIAPILPCRICLEPKRSHAGAHRRRTCRPHHSTLVSWWGWPWFLRGIHQAREAMDPWPWSKKGCRRPRHVVCIKIARVQPRVARGITFWRNEVMHLNDSDENTSLGRITLDVHNLQHMKEQGRPSHVGRWFRLWNYTADLTGDEVGAQHVSLISCWPGPLLLTLTPTDPSWALPSQTRPDRGRPA